VTHRGRALSRTEASFGLAPDMAGAWLAGIGRVYGPHERLLSNLHRK
jgi:hypothetical protein